MNLRTKAYPWGNGDKVSLRTKTSRLEAWPQGNTNMADGIASPLRLSSGMINTTTIRKSKRSVILTMRHGAVGSIEEEQYQHMISWMLLSMVFSRIPFASSFTLIMHVALEFARLFLGSSHGTPRVRPSARPFHNFILRTHLTAKDKDYTASFVAVASNFSALLSLPVALHSCASL